MNYIIRYADIKHSDDLFKDYLLSGLEERDFELSDKGRANLVKFARINSNLNISKIICSPALSCVESAKYLSESLKIEYSTDECLRIVRHDFSKLTNKNKWKDSVPDGLEFYNLRQKFIKQFLNDKLIQDRESIVQRFGELKKILDVQDNTLFISHGTTMKLFYLYASNNFRIDRNILKNSNLDKPFYSSLSGFKYPDLTDHNFC